MNTFSRKAIQGVEQKTQRVTADNKYLKGVQVKDVASIIEEDCVLWVDSDSIPYFAAAQQDDNYVEVLHKGSGRTMEFSNKTEFKGASRKEGVITQKSWLGVKNLEQEAKGKPVFKLEDFEITQKKRLKHDETTAMRYAQSYMKDYFDSILEQSGCKVMKIALGSGYNVRYDQKLPQIYKGARQDQERPILLSACREWAEANYDCVIVSGEEVDDLVQREAYLGTPAVTGKSKYISMLAAIDKDSLGLPCLNFCYQKKGPMWTNPNPWVISDWEVDGDVGIIEMLDGKCKTTSLLHIARQCCTIDQADGYSMYLHFPKEMHPKEKYSDAGFYKQFCILKTPKDVLQGIADRYAITFPKGLQYTAHDGTEMDIDTMTYLEMIFTCVYMLRKPYGEESMKLWFDKYGVDYSALVHNNLPEKPKTLADETTLRSAITELRTQLAQITDATAPIKSETKPLQIERLNKTVDMLKEYDNMFDKLFTEDN